MKYIIVVIMVMLPILNCFGTMITGYMIETVTFNDRIERAVWPKITDKQNYITGGVTFAYPAGYFAMAPTIQVTLLQNAPHPTTEAFVAEVSANSASSTTIMVYQVTGATVAEAPPGAITVYLLATADIP